MSCLTLSFLICKMGKERVPASQCCWEDEMSQGTHGIQHTDRCLMNILPLLLTRGALSVSSGPQPVCRGCLCLRRWE